MLKRIIAFFVMVALCMSAVPLSSAATPNKPSSRAAADIKAAIAKGIVPKRIQSNYQQAITREEFCELLVRRLLIIKNPVELVYYEDTNKGYYNGQVTPETITKAIKCPTFEDTDSLYVKTAYIFGIVNDEKTFKPNGNILRQDAAVMLANYLQATASRYGLYYTEKQYCRNVKNSSNKDIAEVKYRDFKKISTYAIEAVDVCYGNKLMVDYGDKFKPMAYYTREQAIVTINKLIGEVENIILLRGRVRITDTFLTMGWEVGSDFVTLNPVSEFGPNYEETYMFNWGDRRGGSAETDEEIYEPDWNQFCIAKLNSLGVGKKGFYMARMKKHSKWDYGHMIVTTYNKDSLIKYTFKPIKGYIEFDLYGSTYGRDLTEVKPKQIK